MSGLKVLKRSMLIGLGLTVLLLLFGAAAALAADDSNPTPYDNDNYSEGFNAIYPHQSWQSLDTIYYKENVWEAFVKGTGPAGAEIAVYLAKNEAGQPPSENPVHYRVVEPDLTWEMSWNDDLRQPNLVRFATFKDKLFLYTAWTYDHNTGSTLWQRQIDPLDPNDIGPNDDTRWNPPSTSIWSNRPGSSTKSPRVVKGLVVKVMNDTLNVFFQYGGTRDLYRITSTDAVHFSSPQIVHTFAANDCLLNGDVITRGEDGQPMLAFVTKDDADGGKTSIGDCKLWTFDPKTSAVTLVEYLPLDYKDATLVAGDVAGCKPYGTTHLQLWGIGWNNDDLYHMQYVFNPTGTGGSFDPGTKDTGYDASVHVDKPDRGYLTSCIAPQLTADSSIQQYARVWWWGDTTVTDAHGHSLKYAMDYLKRLEPKSVDTFSTQYSPAWVLEGVIYGLPPYYPNGKVPGAGTLKDYYQVLFGLEQSDKVTNTVTTEKTLSVSYKNEGIPCVPSFSMGIGWSDAVQETTSWTQELTQGATLKWSPDSKGAPPPEDGAQAWGIFFVPTITNDRYHVYGPDKTTDFLVEVYYTYISSGVTLIDKVFDKTDPTNPVDPTDPVLSVLEADYWRETTPYPNSLTYWDPAWTSSQTLISASGDPGKYENILPALHWSASASGSAAVDRYIALQNTTEQSKTCTNQIDMSMSAFGFSTAMSGSLSIGSSTTTTFGTKLDVLYGLPGWDASLIDPDNPPKDYNDYLRSMDLSMYLLRATSDEAFWIPDGAKENGITNYPWCITWHVDRWASQGATKDHGTSGPTVSTMVGNVQTDVARSLPQPAALRASLLAKVKAIKAAYDRGNKVAAANTLGSLINEIEAQSGKGIPTASADYWVQLLGNLQTMIRE